MESIHHQMMMVVDKVLYNISIHLYHQDMNNNNHQICTMYPSEMIKTVYCTVMYCNENFKKQTCNKKFKKEDHYLVNIDV